MKTRTLVTLGLLFALASSGSASPQEDVKRVVESFYAQYYKECLDKPGKGDPDKALIRWVTTNSYVSDGFKKAFRKTVLDARKKDPELGLGSDPILNAQDWPSKGYRAKEIQVAAGKASVVMEGIDAPDFKVSVELVNVDNKWRINGIGDINRSTK